MKYWSALKYRVVRKIANSDLFRSIIRESDLQIYSRQGILPEISQDALVKKYIGWVYACSQISATALASTPLKLYATRGTGQKSISIKNMPVQKEKAAWLKSRPNAHAQLKLAQEIVEIPEHPILGLLDSVNENANRFSNLELTDTCEELTGNAYWFVQKNQLGLPYKIFVLRPQWTRIIPGKKQLIDGFIYGRVKENELFLDRKDVVHFKRPNPHNAYYGMGVVQAAAYAVERQSKMDNYELATLSNMGRPDFILKFNKGKLDSESRNDIESDFSNKYGGPKNAGKMKILDEDWSIVNIGWSPKEMEYITGRTWTMKEICAMFPVPVGMIDTEQISKAPRAGMEGSDIFLAKNNTLPRCRRTEQTLNEQLIPMYPEAEGRIFFAFDNPVPTDKAYELSEIGTMLTNYVMTINDVRAMKGMEAVEWGDKPFVPFNVYPFDADAEKPKPVPIPAAEPEPEPEDEEDEEVDGKNIHKDLAGTRIRYEKR